MAEFVFTTTAGDLTRSLDGYDDHVSLATAENAVAVYEEAEEYRRLCRGAGFEDAELHESAATQIGICWTAETILVSARGSSERGDWRDDLSMWRVGWKGVLPAGTRVHYGFKRQFLCLHEHVCARVAQLEVTYPEARLVVTGHSLGGALVPFVVVSLAQKGIEVDAAYCHEMPRTGNRRWKDWYDERFGDRTFRVVNVLRGEPDLVTRIPKQSWGYRHLGRQQILADGVCSEEQALWEYYRQQNPVRTIEALRLCVKLVRGVRAHLGGSLLAALRERCEVNPKEPEE